MKKFLLVVSTTVVGVAAQAQHANFESPALAPESAWYGQDQVTDGDTIYNSGSYNFETNFNAGWGSWAGWAVSNVTDNSTPGWSNQYSAITGAGHNSSSQYGICYASPWEGNRLFNTSAGTGVIAGMYVTNTTYAYYAMLDGDAFTKPFGADTNAQGVIDGTNGEDWFLLTIYGLGADSLYTGDSVNFYLADYRFPSDADDYIVDEWTWVDLSSLGAVKGLNFVLSSTDTSGGFGMNNPSYFAADYITGVYASVEPVAEQQLNAYPNPTTGNFTIELRGESLVSVFDMEGRLLQTTTTAENLLKLDISDYPRGVYLVTAVCNGVVSRQRIIKE